VTKKKYPQQFIICPNCDTTYNVALYPEIKNQIIRQFLEEKIQEYPSCICNEDSWDCPRCQLEWILMELEEGK